MGSKWLMSERSSRRLWGQRPGQPIKAAHYNSGGIIRLFEYKTLVCKECGNEFVFTAGEQEFYAEKGFMNEPSRCKSCRDARKASRNSEREMYETTCAECGAPTRVPFVPKTDRPIYCSECFAKKRGA